MSTLKDKRIIKGLDVVAFKKNEAQILCKITITPSDAIELCKTTKSGLFKNRDLHDCFISMITTQLEKVIQESKGKLNDA